MIEVVGGLISLAGVIIINRRRKPAPTAPATPVSHGAWSERPAADVTDPALRES